MKRAAARHPRSPRVPLAWRHAEYAALRAIEADDCDDRVSDDIFDIDDERTAVDLIISGMTRFKQPS
jgi:hypothetical protein